MTNRNNIPGTVSSKKKAGVTVTLEGGRQGFLPTASFGDINPKKGDKLTVDIVSEERGLLQLALSTKEQIMEPDIVTSFDERIAGLVAAASAPFTPAPVIIDELERVLPARTAEAFPSACGKTNQALLADNQSEGVSPLLLEAIEDAKTCFLSADTEHSCGDVDEGTPGSTSESPVSLFINEAEQSSKARQSRAPKGIWAQLRLMAESEKNFKLTLKRVKDQPGLFATYRGIQCFLPKDEIPGNFDMNLVPEKGSEQWVKIISFSKPKQKVLVSMRIKMSRAELLKISESKTAELNHRKQVQAKSAAARAATAAAAAIAVEKDYEWLCEGQEVHGEVVKILKNTGKGGKPFVMYFVRVGTQLAGVLREFHIPFEQGTRRPRVFKVGDRVKVRVIRKFRGQDKTGADVPKVDLAMRRPEDSRQSKGQHGKPRVWTFGEKTQTPEAGVLSHEQQRRGKGNGGKGKPVQGMTGKKGGEGKGKGGNTQPHLTTTGTAIGDKLQAALAARLA